MLIGPTKVSWRTNVDETITQEQDVVEAEELQEEDYVINLEMIWLVHIHIVGIVYGIICGNECTEKDDLWY